MNNDFLNIDELNENELLDLINGTAISYIEESGSNLMDVFLID